MTELFVIEVLYSEPTLYYYGLTQTGRVLLTDSLEEATMLTKEESKQVLNIINMTSQLHFSLVGSAVPDEGEDLEPI